MTDDAPTTRSFERDMASIYDRAKAAGYNATRFLTMVHEHGGLETAHRLLASADVSYGFGELWLMGRQDLTVEAHVLRPEYRSLFSDAQLRTARERLGSHAARFEGPPPAPVPEAARPRWTLEMFVSAASNQDLSTRATIEKFANWLRPKPDATHLGSGETGPLYFAPANPQGKQVPAVCIYLDGTLELLFNELKGSPPFDRVAKRIELQRRLNAILGFEIGDYVVESGTWKRMDAAYLLSPAAFGEFARVYEWVGSELEVGERT